MVVVVGVVLGVLIVVVVVVVVGHLHAGTPFADTPCNLRSDNQAMVGNDPGTIGGGAQPLDERGLRMEFDRDASGPCRAGLV